MVDGACECEEGKFPNTTVSNCSDCAEDCKACDGPNADDCTDCEAGHNLVNGVCEPICDENCEA
jgi:hypothetical protein